MKTSAMRVQDMTTGDPLPLILRFAIPLFIGNIFQQLYNMVDTMVVGYHLGDTAIAAIGATTSLYSFVVNFAGGLNSGYGIVVTQRFGAHDEKHIKQAIAGMMLLGGGVALILTVLALTFLGPLMTFMNTPETIFAQAYSYIFIIYAGLIATVGYNMFAAILRAVGNSRSPLYFLILSSVLNIGLDLLFVVVFEMSIGGAAIATVIAQVVSASLCGIYVFRNYRSILPDKSDFRVSAPILKELFSTGIAMALMSCVVDMGSIIFQRANNMLGQTYIAAHAAARKLLMMMIQPQATIAVANSTFTGQNWGARKFDRIRSTLRKVLLLEVGWGVTATAIIYLFGGALVRFTTGTEDPAVIENAVLSLRIHFSTFPVLGVLFCIRNTMQAMGRKVAPVISSCIELLMKILSAAWLIPRLGFVGTCITEPVTWVLMVAFLMTVYLTQRKKIFAA